ncbi:hypothetical protein P3T76_012424 [Phytophthora citrophthora]|uniref:Crinkler (CRN) family protein n=1 Tax=Phytophthora citrophthora TaxID=4793 RepID=A0AAD9G4H5_9STRA|nr:hypothetical protein P3T76_012424 [Phytophthora citrophthora]
MPVCSGISGSDKTRMLEEGGTILKTLQLDPKHVFRVIVSYNNEFDLQSIENSIPIEASFSWRLLYRFFLDKNCSLSFADWLMSRLPSNSYQLSLDDAIAAIERKLRQTITHNQERLYLFLGIDEYEKVKHVRVPPRDPERPLQREIMDIIGNFLCSNVSKLVVLPMFAGNSPYYVSKQLPMTPLSLDQVVRAMESTK